MLIPAFQLHLSDPIQTGLATVGKYDGKHPSLTAATSGGKIFIHNPYVTDGSVNKNGVKYLNNNKQVSAVGAGNLDESSARDVLLLGTQSDLLAYDVDENKDSFFKDVPDGVNSIVCGKVGSVEVPLAVVGGNCSIQGFDAEGSELFWTVCGDNVSALALADTNGDGLNELLVGSDDFEIRTFENEDAVAVTTEAERVVGLCSISNGLYGYALANGTIGVYNQSVRVWRVKSKNQVQAIAAFDLDGDGEPELISGWSNGKLEVRSDRTGEVIYRDNFSSGISAILKADYRCDGQEEIICCSADGQVKGYLPAKGDQEMGRDLLGRNNTEEALAELNQRKQELMYELGQYEKNLSAVKDSPNAAKEGIVPMDTHVALSLELSPERQCVELVLMTNNETLIKGAIVFAEQLFDGESLYVHAPAPAASLRVPLNPKKDVTADMLIKVLVGARSNPVFHVFELDYTLPKFIMYYLVKDRVPEPQSSVTFRTNERVQRIILWLDAAFNTNLQGLGTDRLDVQFVSLRDGKPLSIKFVPEQGQLFIRTDDMETAGEIVQDLSSHIGITELESTADFPYEMEAFRNVLLKVDEYNAVRLKLSAEVADSSNVVKMYVIKAEDARILNDMALMKKHYMQLFDLNRELIMEHTKRATNHSELLAALKDVNQMIQRAARLRVGKAKANVVSACRAAIKQNNILLLFQIISGGGNAPGR